nr:LysE family translocator [uncultured Hyphomonas sp.]
MFENWLAFAGASAALVVIPGPTVLLVLSYALSAGQRIALATVLGVVLGDIIAMSVSLAGLGAVLLASAVVFQVLKWIGAAYLVYLGIGMIRSSGAMRLDLPEVERAINAKRAFAHAAAVTALNPKSILFFIAFVPQFISPDVALATQFAAFTLTFVFLGAATVLIYALLAVRLREKLSAGTLPWLGRIGGGVLVGMGVLTATYRRAA